jgi:positive regulator of sigma E activity
MEVITMRERGVVIDVENGRALIEVTPAAGCGKNCSCSAVEGRPHLRRVQLEAPAGVRRGAHVTLEVSSGQVLASSALVFLGPLVCLILGLLVSRPLLGALGIRMNADLGMMLVGAVAFLAGLAGALFVSQRRARRGWLVPRIVEVVNPGS